MAQPRDITTWKSSVAQGVDEVKSSFRGPDLSNMAGGS